jgi:hypothetical protein
MGKGLIFSGINMRVGHGTRTIPYSTHRGGCRFLALLGPVAECSGGVGVKEILEEIHRLSEAGLRRYENTQDGELWQLATEAKRMERFIKETATRCALPVQGTAIDDSRDGVGVGVAPRPGRWRSPCGSLPGGRGGQQLREPDGEPHHPGPDIVAAIFDEKLVQGRRSSASSWPSTTPWWHGSGWRRMSGSPSS